MNKKFLLVDRINNVQNEATYILSFKYNNDEYLIYYLDESDNNKQIFVSKMIRNNDEKIILSDINSVVKNKINTIVYNIVVILPFEANKNSNYSSIIDSFKNKNNISFSLETFDIDSQKYLYNSRVAITSNILVNNCIDFYNSVLNTNQNDKHKEDQKINLFNQILDDKDVNIQSEIVSNNVTTENNLVFSTSNAQDSNISTNNQVSSVNPQMKILENINSNSIQLQPITSNNIINKNNDNNEKEKNEGFIINVSIIVGTIAILLAVIIVAFTFITIKKMII